MKKRILAVGACLLAAAGLSTRPASAIGPVDVEVGAGYWNADTEITELNASESASAPALFGNVWLKNALGFGVSRYEASPGGSLEGTDSDFTAVDAKWRFLNATRNNFVAVGLGGEQVAIANESTIAPRLVVEGHVSVKLVYFFGKGAYLPTIGEMGEGVDGKDGMELEAGVGFHPIPLLSVQLSYKSNDMDFEVTDPLLGTANISVNNAGPMLGLVFSF